MPKYAVAYINFFDNALNITFHEAADWREALGQVIAFDINELSQDIETAKSEAFDQDWMFDIKEISNN